VIIAVYLIVPVSDSAHSTAILSSTGESGHGHARGATRDAASRQPSMRARRLQHERKNTVLGPSVIVCQRCVLCCVRVVSAKVARGSRQASSSPANTASCVVLKRTTAMRVSAPKGQKLSTAAARSASQRRHARLSPLQLGKSAKVLAPCISPVAARVAEMERTDQATSSGSEVRILWPALAAMCVGIVAFSLYTGVTSAQASAR
jgi:hypothetical protein